MLRYLTDIRYPLQQYQLLGKKDARIEKMGPTKISSIQYFLGQARLGLICHLHILTIHNINIHITNDQNRWSILLLYNHHSFPGTNNQTTPPQHPVQSRAIMSTYLIPHSKTQPATASIHVSRPCRHFTIPMQSLLLLLST